MIVVRVELHSAVTGRVTELARAHISNVGGDAHKGNYEIRTLRGRDRAALDRRVVQRTGKVFGHARQALHVWHLIARALIAVGYAQQPHADEHVADAGRLMPGD
jgi:hypothetical protein